MADRGDTPADDLWVFAYGSLMWNPGFAFEERVRATLVGYRRAFCIYSTYYRGTRIRPGLVLGLDRGGACEGIAFRVAAAEAAGVLEYLRLRELIYGVYREVRLTVTLANDAGTRVVALTYVAERRHPAYAGALPLARQSALIRGARGRSGTNVAYLANTGRHLRQLGIRQRELERLSVSVGGGLLGDREMPRDLEARGEALSQAWRFKPVIAPRWKRSALERFTHRVSIARSPIDRVKS